MTHEEEKSNIGRTPVDAEMCREVITRMDRDLAWDQTQAKDLDPQLMDYVRTELIRGVENWQIARSLGFYHGTSDRRWKKIEANLRRGFRGDAEAYIFMQSRRLFKKIERAGEILDDAMENGVPVIVEVKEKGNTVGHEVMHVKGATKELATFLKAYSEAMALPVRLWKEYGAIGEKKDTGSTNPTIIVQNNIQMPTQEEILARQAEVEAKSKAIETTHRIPDAESKT